MSRALQQLSNKYGQQAADLAGFPVEVALELEGGFEAYIQHSPDDVATDNDSLLSY